MPRCRRPTRPDNQRLEFLGDRVLGLVMAEALLHGRPGARRRAACPALQRAGAQGNLRRRRARDRPGRRAEARPVRDDVGRAAERGAAGRRDGGGDCRRLSGCRLRGGAGAGPAALGRPDRRGARRTPATPRPRLQEWAQARGHAAAGLCRSWPRGPGPPAALHRRGAAGRRRDRGRRRPGSKRQAEQAAAHRRLLARMETTDDRDDRPGHPRGLCRPDRRAQCRANRRF